HHRYEYYYSVYFPGDPTVYKTYQETIILPVGSVPGIWGLAEMTVWDKAQNKLLADFTEIVRFEVETASAKPVAMPDGPQLQQNAPNPFNSQTVIPYFLLEPGAARLEVFALTGQRVAVLNQGPQQAGHYRLHWDGRDREGRPLASGVYLYRLVTPESVLTRKLILLR
ncbi:MAG: T9SS type A sorting domain-containing protein, partial [Gemmatimonadetes bacterium]|nr:T9SS type A sorting domain-containing protein [Gemmatimonadota bacterium]